MGLAISRIRRRFRYFAGSLCPRPQLSRLLLPLCGLHQHVHVLCWLIRWSPRRSENSGGSWPRICGAIHLCGSISLCICLPFQPELERFYCLERFRRRWSPMDSSRGAVVHLTLARTDDCRCTAGRARRSWGSAPPLKGACLFAVGRHCGSPVPPLSFKIGELAQDSPSSQVDADSEVTTTIAVQGSDPLRW